MKKYALLIPGIAGSLLISWGIIAYQSISTEVKERLYSNTHLFQLDASEETLLHQTKATLDPQEEFPENNNQPPFIISGRIYMNQYQSILSKKEPQDIEQLSLNYINKMIEPAYRGKGIKALAKIEFSSDIKLAKYTIRIYEKQPPINESGGFGYTLILKKNGTLWDIIEAKKRFCFLSTWKD